MNMKHLKKRKGFTLIELVIVIVIIGILAIVSVPIYRGYTRRAMASEGRALLGSVSKSQKVYYAEHGQFLTVANTGTNPDLDVDATMNKYFKTFAVTGGASAFTATASGTGDASGISITLQQTYGSEPTLTEAGL